MTFQLFGSFFAILNSLLLIYSIYLLPLPFTIFFCFSEIVIFWFIWDNHSFERNRILEENKKRKGINSISIDQKWSSHSEKATPLSSIEFELSKGPQFQPLQAIPIVEKIKFIDAKEESDQKTYLQQVEELIEQNIAGKKKLIICNLPSQNPYAKKLSDALAGRCSEQEILQKNIVNQVDLIPYMGLIGSIPSLLLKNFITDKAAQYDSIIFCLRSHELSPIQQAYQNTQQTAMVFVPEAQI